MKKTDRKYDQSAVDSQNSQLLLQSDRAAVVIRPNVYTPTSRPPLAEEESSKSWSPTTRQVYSASRSFATAIK